MTGPEKAALQRALASIRNSLTAANQALSGAGDDVAFRAATVQARDNLVLVCQWSTASQVQTDIVATLNGTAFP